MGSGQMEEINEKISILNQECAGAKKLEGDKLSSFIKMFGIGDELGDIFYNEYNMIFLDKQTFENIRYLVPQHEVVVSFEALEYNEFIFVIRYFQDTVLSEALG
jgi:hypothetical protein